MSDLNDPRVLFAAERTLPYWSGITMNLSVVLLGYLFSEL